jgi:hypothetical protein
MCLRRSRAAAWRAGWTRRERTAASHDFKFLSKINAWTQRTHFRPPFSHISVTENCFLDLLRPVRPRGGFSWLFVLHSESTLRPGCVRGSQEIFGGGRRMTRSICPGASAPSRPGAREGVRNGSVLRGAGAPRRGQCGNGLVNPAKPVKLATPGAIAGGRKAY